MRQFKINQSITRRTGEALDKYLVEISRIPMISPDQEVELAQIIHKGGKAHPTKDLRGKCCFEMEGWHRRFIVLLSLHILHG